MHIQPIKTHRIGVRENLTDILDRYLADVIMEKHILAITSKIVSVCEGRVVNKADIDKETLIYQEADAVAETPTRPYNFYLTLKQGLLIPSAGIDESNGDDVYILYPQDSQQTAITIWNYLRQRYQIRQLGIIITDSHTTPLRRGVTGITLGWCGFAPLYSYIGQPDLYNHPLRVTQINIIDALASAAVLVMGEGAEQTPLACIRDAPKITFLDRPPTSEEYQSVTIPLAEDLYAPLLAGVTFT